MDVAAPVVSPGDVLDGKYVVERLIGEGGMGVVVAARHSVLGTRVAIKVLQPRARIEPDTLTRFHREARSAVRITSVHAARVHDVGELANGTPYMVMDLLAGRDLDALLTERGALAPAETVGFVLQALDALQEAHALGIIHRDLKPANLFLAEQASGPPIVKVLDFGIARDFSEGNEQRLTRTREVMGSPTYMSPEQMRESRAADARSDVWSIGVCLYELLTGKGPFDAATLPDLFVRVLHGTPEPPQSLRPEIPAGLADIILRCLEKDPAQRFQSAVELTRALAPWASEATWPEKVPSTTLASVPALHSTGRLATSRTLPNVTPLDAASPRSLRVLRTLAPLVAIGVLGAALAVSALVFRTKDPPVALAAAEPASAASAASAPVPVDLSAAGAITGTPASPPTRAGATEPAPPASPPSSKGAPATPGHAAARHAHAPPPTPTSVAAKPSAPAPSPAATPAPPAFDPKTSF